ncbi:MAG: type 2 isopentenyl-diphosphate Delta-isomerase [Halobacteriota archaeon]|nr:type 2 isopentenyl-diphosphate Delta-isomerase [Halobacteriota archaeon]
MNKTAKRKLDHIKICTQERVESITSCFQDIKIIHKATPEIDKRDIDLTLSFLGRRLQMPFMIASMTGGHPGTIKVNESLAKAAEEMQIGIGVGSQRAALEDPEQEDSFRVMRDNAPNAFIYGNIGAAQLEEYGVEGVEKAVDMIDANAVAVHLNFLQEAIQPEGEANAKGVLSSIKDLSSSVKVPVIVKETGAGISFSVAEELAKAGVSAIDVGGVGGTSWAGVEVYRAIAEGDKLLENMGRLFWDWGLPTPVSIAECASVGPPIIASGGIRTGLDMAKSITLGADLCSAALPFVKPALDGPDQIIEILKRMEEELRVAMFLSGSSNVEELKKAQIVILGETRDIILQRGRMKLNE